jgi:hypothetical protein
MAFATLTIAKLIRVVKTYVCELIVDFNAKFLPYARG